METQSKNTGNNGAQFMVGWDSRNRKVPDSQLHACTDQLGRIGGD
jgi:hypothetical protein